MAREATRAGKELERRVADAYRQMRARKVEHDVELAGNQIDVYVELETPGRLLHRIAVEVKDWSKPVGIDVVNGFAAIASLLHDRRLIDEGIIVSASGFTKQARNAAKEHSICLLEPADLEAMVAQASAAEQARPATPSVHPPSIPSDAQPESEPIQAAGAPPLRPCEGSARIISPPETPAQAQAVGVHPDVPTTVTVPAGPFWLGSLRDDPEADENEKPRQKLELPEYQIGRYPVTNAQYACFLVANPDYRVPYVDEERARPYNWDPQTRVYPEGKADHPVVLVSWHDAEAYCRWLSQATGQRYRLPTEEEWEKAARGGCPDTRRYPWVGEWQPNYCNTQELGQNGTTPVCEFEQTNRSPFGAVDMAGNVWEWTNSWYEPYPGSSPQGLHFGQVYRVVRGGSWRSDGESVRISCRGRYKPDIGRPYLGFRIVLAVGVQVAGTVSAEVTSEEANQAGKSAQVVEEEIPGEVKGRAGLRQSLMACFDASELQNLCSDLAVDYDSLRGESKGDKARELIAYLERRGRISELIEACRQLRPNVPW